MPGGRARSGVRRRSFPATELTTARGDERRQLQRRETVGHAQRLAVPASRLSFPQDVVYREARTPAPFETRVVLQPARDAERQGRDDDFVVSGPPLSAFLDRPPAGPGRRDVAGDLPTGQASLSRNEAAAQHPRAPRRTPTSSGLATSSPAGAGSGKDFQPDRPSLVSGKRCARRSSRILGVP